MFIDGNKWVAQLMANKVVIENNVGNFQISIESLEDFKELLPRSHETGNDTELIGFMKSIV
jgi:hypothetical protein